MKNELSSMLDNELDADRYPLLLQALRSQAELRATLDSYLLVGDALRGSAGLSTNLTDSVMAKLDKEPTILAPSRKNTAGAMRNFAALAASLTGVAVVGWLAFVPATQTTPLPPVAKIAKPEVVATSERMQEYLMAHQAYSPSSRIQGGASYIRTISTSR